MYQLIIKTLQAQRSIIQTQKQTKKQTKKQKKLHSNVRVNLTASHNQHPYVHHLQLKDSIIATPVSF